MGLISLDGSQGEGGGQVIRTALALSAATGRGFEIKGIRGRRPQPGLRPQHLAAVRSLTLACGAKVSGALDGSQELRFEPGPVLAGEFNFEIATAGALSLVLETVLPPLALAPGPSRVAITGGTHVPWSPSYHYLANHWAAVVRPLGLELGLRLERAGFYPPGGGLAHAEVKPWARPAAPLKLEERGRLLEVRGTSGASHLKNRVAERHAQAAQARLWEARRLEVAWNSESAPAASPGSYVLLEAVFEKSRAAFGFLGERGVAAETIGDRAARALLRFLDGEAAVDQHLADQLAVPLALSGGGRVTTSQVTAHLETVAAVLPLFGFPARVLGRRGSPGVLEVGPEGTV